MILPDTSAWIEYLNATEGPADRRLRSIFEVDEPVVLSEVVVMEVLAGVPSERDAVTTRSAILEFPIVPLRGLTDFEEAARIYRTCRAAGETVRKMTDCLVAVAALRADASVLHLDRDFDVIARHTDLRIEPVA